MLNTLVGLLFPNLCVGCNGVLLAAEQHICTHCIEHFPETKFHTLPENQLEKAFWGRIKIERAFSFLTFRKQGIVQKILHELKYSNNPELGVMLGQMYGSKLHEYGLYFDVILAIPLHEKKEKLRGYNQSDCFAQGLAQSLKCEHLKNVIVRDKFTETQTKKGRFDRWLNVGDVFGIKSPALIQNKKILLVDDVITTGATIEACAQSILVHTPHLSVASIACVVNQ
jgi:ComF family protein